MPWLPTPHDDQHLAGGILWATGDLVGLVLFGVLFVQWVRSSMAEAEREDRRLDRLEARAPAAGRDSASDPATTGSIAARDQPELRDQPGRLRAGARLQRRRRTPASR